VSGTGPPLRVLGWPAFANRREQPYNALLYGELRRLGVVVQEYTAARVLTGRWDVLHLHWPDRRVRDDRAAAALLRSTALIALLDAARARGTRVIWTVHNLQAHEGTYRPRLEEWYWTALTRRLHGYISMSDAGIELIRSRFPQLRGTPGFVVPHGHMRGVYADTVDRAQARSRLGLDPHAVVIGCFGQLRAYKNVTHLVHTFRELRRPDLALLVAGRPKPAGLAAELHAAAGDDPRVRIVADFIPDDELQLYLRAADVVVLPYRDIFNSGSAMLALSFDTPVLVPRTAGMQDLADRIGADWVRTYEGELSAVELETAMDRATAPGRPQRPALDELGWDRIAQATLDAYRAVTAR
jgi:beta-1,4-mannosyltransferase